MNQRYKVFDAHTHAFPDAIARGAVDGLSEKAGIAHFHNGSYDELAQYEAQADGYLLLPIATKPAQMRSVNTWAAQKMGGKMQAFGSVHPLAEDWRPELDHVQSLGLKGIKLHPEYQDFYADDPRHFPLYAEIFARGLILCFHAGVDLGFPPPLHGAAEAIARVADAFPNGRIIAAHMGGYQQFDEAMAHLAGRENLWMDTSYVADEMAKEQLVQLSRAHGIDRILFATDAPWKPFDSMLAAVLNAGFDEDELQKILYQNAAKLLNLEDA
ncbi:amidohydrolase family protein [Eubacteriales bacterium OttesenSCG-928-N13]|nr:amidohydrolase family protein [Eubacteriales bacterium OttesenSCG-928-N13]